MAACHLGTWHTLGFLEEERTQLVARQLSLLSHVLDQPWAPWAPPQAQERLGVQLTLIQLTLTWAEPLGEL